MARLTPAGVLLVALMAIMGLAGCGDDESEAPAAAPDESSLVDIPWTLTAGIDGAEDVAPSMTFTDGKVAGSAGCNRFTATYELDGAALTIGPAATTKKACIGTVAKVEAEFLAALQKVETWNVSNEELVLGGAGDEELLRFRVGSLAGTWTVTSLLHDNAVSSPIPGTELTATFGEDGKLTGAAGCNTYKAAFSTDGARITIDKPASTDEQCTEPEGVMGQEQSYLDALSLATDYSIEGSRLNLLTAKGSFAVIYTRAP